MYVGYLVLPVGHLNQMHNRQCVQRRPPEAPVRSEILNQDSNVKRGRGRPKLTWVEVIKGDLK